RHDVRMRERDGDARLLGEVRARSVVAGALAADALEHHGLVHALGTARAGKPDFAHAATIERTDELVAAEGRLHAAKGSTLDVARSSMHAARDRAGPSRPHRMRPCRRGGRGAWRR